jgi:hypothetical protein
MQGYVYVLANSAMPKLLKIGYTTRTVADRIQELTTTGVPGRFVAEFYCEVENAPRLERAVHLKLASKRFDKEFFRCDITLAVKTIKESALDQSIEFYSSGGRSIAAYITDEERREIDTRAAKRIEKERFDAQQKLIRDAKVKSLVSSFMEIAPAVDRIIRSNQVGGLREAASILVGLTGIGLLVSDAIAPPPLLDGARIAKLINSSEREKIKRFKLIVKDLHSLNGLDEAFEQYNKKHGIKNCYLVTTKTYNNSKYDISDWVSGLFSKV